MLWQAAAELGTTLTHIRFALELLAPTSESTRNGHPPTRAGDHPSHRNRPSPAEPRPYDSIAVERVRISHSLLDLLRHILDYGDQEFYGWDIIERAGRNCGTLYTQLARLNQAGWLTSRPEDEDAWLAGAPPGRGPGRRRTYYTLTPDGRKAAEHELAQHPTPEPTKQEPNRTMRHHKPPGQPRPPEQEQPEPTLIPD